MNVLLLIAAVATFALPLLVAGFVMSRFDAPVRLIAIGAGTFLASQVVHLPLNALIGPHLPAPALTDPGYVWAVCAYGFTAGLCEETARWIAFRLASPKAAWRDMVALGVGHGGVEALIIGVISISIVLKIIAYSNPDLVAALPDDGTREAVQAQMATLATAHWYDAFVGLVERMGAMGFHLGACALVWRFALKNPLWLIVPIGAHTALDAGSLFLGLHGYTWLTEGIVVASGVGGLALAIGLRPPVAPPAPLVSKAAPPLPAIQPLDADDPAADRSTRRP